MKTFSTRPADVRREWHVIDATDQSLGRLSTQVAVYLRGKHKPIYAPHLDVGDFVIVVNAEKVRLTGRKLEQKNYYHHSGYPGGLKVRALKQEIEVRPDRVIERAVRGMLPKGPLGLHLFKHLKVYRGAEHPHMAQVRAVPLPFVAPPPGSNTPDAPASMTVQAEVEPVVPATAPAPMTAQAEVDPVVPATVPELETSPAEPETPISPAETEA